MKNSLKLADLPEALRQTDVAFVDDVLAVNFRPHPYMIGAQHIAYAADHCSGILGEEVINKIPCAHGRCNLSYKEHTSDLVAFVKLRRNCTNAEIHSFLLAIKNFVEAESKHLDGFALVETPEKYRIET